MTARVAVLASGAGSNLQAILDYFHAQGESRAAEVVLVASDRAAAKALDRARDVGIDAVHIDATGRTTGLKPLLAAHNVDLIALAGYLRFVPVDVTRQWSGRILNVHPSLLPAFGGAGMYGLRVHEAVVASGARITGATVHFVDEAYDRGPIVAQWPVPVFADDSADSIAARVLAIEHWIYPAAIDAVARGRVALGADGRITGLAMSSTTDTVFSWCGTATLPTPDMLFAVPQLP
jgi:formyltetrahydrofolate-dependent phosphoribosylglycinamide formyltransferase